MIFNLSEDGQWLILDLSSVEDQLHHHQLELCLTKKAKNYFFHPLYKKKINGKPVWDGSISFLHKKRFVQVGLWNELLAMGKQYKIPIEIKGLDSIIDYTITLEDFTVFVNELFTDHEFIKPYAYQIEAAWKIIKFRYSIMELATSSGKTLINFIVVCYLIKNDRLKKFLMIVPNVTLVNQATDDFLSYGARKLGMRFKHIFDGAERNEQDANIVIGTYQSLTKKPAEFYKDMNVVCIDEAHQSGVVSIKNILKEFGSLPKEDVVRYGLSGTIPGEGTADHFTIQSCVGPMIMKVSSEFLINEGYASAVHIRIIVMDWLPESKKEALYKLKADKTDIDSTKIFSIEKRLVTESNVRLNFITDYMSKTTKNSLVLFQDIQNGYGTSIYNELRRKNSDKEIFYIDGSTAQDLREEYKRRLETGSNRILVASFGTFSTGISVKNLHNIFLVESYKSEIIIGQSLGRLMRLHGDKEFATVVDFVDDFSWKGKKNYLMKHSDERIEIYEKKMFPYKIFKINLNNIMKNNNTQRMLDKIKEDISKILSNCEFKFADNITRLNVKSTVQKYMCDNFDISVIENINFDVISESDQSITIQPLNLYTFLTFNGVNVPYSIVKDKTKFETENGTFELINNTCYYKPKMSVKYINVNIIN
jgi:superfamily II DNA or RNA helicase